MAKAKPEATTAWIRYSQAKALVSEYLRGDPDFVEDEILRGLKTGEIPCRCARFDAPEGYSGPDPSNPEFWKFEGQECTRDGSAVIKTWRAIYIEGDTVTRTDDAVARGIDLGRGALIGMKLLPPDDVVDIEVDVDATTTAKVWVPREARILKRAGKLAQAETKTELADLLLAVGKEKGLRIASRDYIRDKLEDWGLWPISKIKT